MQDSNDSHLKVKRLTTRQISAKILSLAVPMTAIQLITVASGFLCMVMLARLGHDVLAASALIYSTQMSIIVIGMSILFSLSVLVGHAYGEKNYASIGNYVQQAWTLGVLISLPIMLIFYRIETLLLFCGQLKSIVLVVKQFFHAYAWGVIPTMLLVCNQQFCYAVHKQKLIIYTSFISIVILLFFAYGLIFGKFGMPNLGVAGLGYAMAAQNWFAFLFTMLCFYYFDYFKQFDLFNYRVHKNWNYLVRMFQIGWPISFQTGGEMLSFFISAAIIGWLGTVSLAAYQVINQYRFLVLIPLFALSQASGILVGQAFGAKQYYEIQKIGGISMVISLIASLFIGCLFFFMPKALASAYLDVNAPANAETVKLILSLFSITAFALIVDSFRNVLIGAVRGLLDTRVPMLVTLLSLWLIGIPLSYFLAFNLNWGVIGVAIGSASGMLIGAIIMWFRWRRLSRHYGSILSI